MCTASAPTLPLSLPQPGLGQPGEELARCSGRGQALPRISRRPAQALLAYLNSLDPLASSPNGPHGTGRNSAMTSIRLDPFIGHGQPISTQSVCPAIQGKEPVAGQGVMPD